MEFEDLLDVPGMGTLLEFAPIFGTALWILITTLLWRGGFRDLAEQVARPNKALGGRSRALMMMPLRALLLAGVAAIGAFTTTLGLGFNIAIILNIVYATQSATAG